MDFDNPQLMDAFVKGAKQRENLLLLYTVIEKFQSDVETFGLQHSYDKHKAQIYKVLKKLKE
jgi:hypothetical protein